MTPTQLLEYDMVELSKMSDDQLVVLIAPLFPAARAEFTGAVHDNKAIIMPSGKRVTLKQVEKDNAMLMNLLKMAGKV